DMGYRAEKGCDVYNIAKKDWVKDVSKSWRDPGFPQTDQHPVVCVDFDDAKAYAQWLSRKTDKMYRLASEAEREYATRARTATRFFWGDDPAYGEMCRYANGWDQSVKKLNPQRETAPCNDGHIYTAPVGSFEANRFGLHDVSGNVWEWTEDTWNETYSGAPRDGRASTGGDIFRRVLRGGSWGSNPESLRSAARWRYGISGRSDVIGF